MAQIKTPYGLVYNTDGTLCTTYRDDVVPFRGVRSFAVETATTNLIQNPSFETSTNWAHFPSTYNFWTDEKALFGSHCFKRSRLDTSDTNNDFVSQSIFNPPSGVVYTLSAYVNITKHIQGMLRIYGRIHYTDSTTSDITGISYNSITNGWVRKSFTFTTVPNKTIDYISIWIHGMFHGGNFFGEAYVDGIQLEAKPFASSFVDGTRPAGRLVIPKEQLGFNPATDDWVISYWKYPIATDNDTLTSANLFLIGQLTSARATTFINWGKHNFEDRLRIEVTLNNNTNDATFSSTFDPTWYFRNWHYEVMMKHGSIIEYWVDGIQQCSLVLSLPLMNNLTQGLVVNGSWNAAPCNSYIANLYYGLYTDQWTDEYIREVYEAKIPFSAQNKLSIY